MLDKSNHLTESSFVNTTQSSLKLSIHLSRVYLTLSVQKNNYEIYTTLVYLLTITFIKTVNSRTHKKNMKKREKTSESLDQIVTQKRKKLHLMPLAKLQKKYQKKKMYLLCSRITFGIAAFTTCWDQSDSIFQLYDEAKRGIGNWAAT